MLSHRISALSRGPSSLLLPFGSTALTVTGAALLYAAFHSAPVRAATSSYTVWRTESVFDNTGILQFTNHYVEAFRSDGAKAFRSTTKDVQKREIYFPNGEHVRVNELMGAKSTYLNEAGAQAIIRNPQESCASEQELGSGWVVAGRDTIAGHAASRLQHMASDGTWTIWYGLDLHCAVLQLRLEHASGITKQELAAVVLGEPDASLFQLSTALKEVPPSQLFGCPDPTCKALPSAYLERLDRHYYQLKPNANAVR